MHISHRHFVAAPVFAFVVATSLVTSALSSASASVLGFPGNVRLPFGATGELSPGSRFEDDTAIPVLREGAVLASGEHRVILQSSYLFLTGFAGGYHVISDGEGLTVAALTSPVLISTGAGESAIVPVGMQWRGNRNDLLAGDTNALLLALSPLPAEYMQEKVDALVSLQQYQREIVDSSDAGDDTAILSAFHPLLRSQAPLSADSAMLPFLLLADRLPEPLPQSTLEQWSSAVASAVRESRDPAIALEPFLQALTQFLEEHQTRFPDRARRYTEILISLAERYEPIMTEELAVLRGWKQMLEAPQYEPIPMEAEAENSSSQILVAPFDPVAIEAAARTLLSQVNALWTLQTTVRPLSATVVHIEGIGFPTANGDKLFTFDLDISMSDVRNIVIDGKVLPNALPLPAFIEWVGQN